MELIELFTKNLSAKQKQYEAIRAVAFHRHRLSETSSTRRAKESLQSSLKSNLAPKAGKRQMSTLI